MDQYIAQYFNNLITQHLNSARFSSLTEEQKIALTTTLRAKLYKTAIEELINKLNQDQLNQIANLDFTSPEMEAKLEEFAATIPNFSSILEERFQQELASSQPPNLG